MFREADSLFGQCFQINIPASSSFYNNVDIVWSNPSWHNRDSFPFVDSAFGFKFFFIEN